MCVIHYTGSEEQTESVHTDYGSEVTSIATLEEFQSAYSDLGGKYCRLTGTVKISTS